MNDVFVNVVLICSDNSLHYFERFLSYFSHPIQIHEGGLNIRNIF